MSVPAEATPNAAATPFGAAQRLERESKGLGTAPPGTYEAISPASTAAVRTNAGHFSVKTRACAAAA